ncbi:TonB-dependent receptor [Novosphingobium sp. KCTC 2891]|uniref:TonB-dependent receptor plug domain-containing protein n=1 Tax=Novosphingobium sp. KCTC 2891 TaxID=2989730 RepID=UPI0022223B8F|nr:TonB-dependent receptor [Novosphingobium sp. KCTC 2891]MCW1381400.1 TonB-dependent receptor [Novosphingobium sp. KCTC 2891]
MLPLSRIAFTALLASTAISTSALAQEAPAEAEAADSGGSDIIVTGTRVTGMRAADSAAPVQVVGTQAMQNIGQQDLTQVLAQTLPSLNFQAFGGDTANLTLTAALRGLSPNDTLVLINGKRRHFTANLAVLGGSPYSGAATTDLSFIPTNAIGRIEVLQDGAAAQYGSDAIAGVVNIILKNQSSGGLFTVTGGQYYEGDGETASAALNMGFALGDRGYVNVTGEYKFHNYTQRGGCDRRYFTEGCEVRSDINPIDAAGVKANPFYPRVNNILGDARYSLYNVMVNAGYELTDNVEAYAFGSYGNRTAFAYENYRRATRVSGVTSEGEKVYPLTAGFNPQESLREEDFSLTTGLKGDASGWLWDLSLTYGRDSVAISTVNSANPALYAQVQSQNPNPVSLQRDFYDGTLVNSEWAVEAGVTKDVEVGMAKPLTVAFGGQWRKDTYAIQSGEFASYFAGGAQSYPGFAPTDAGANSRTAWAGYVDLALDPVEGLHLDLAGRYEHYSDFGKVWTGKATARYDFSPAIGIRGTVSNGFRAPTLAESYYSSVNVGPGTIFGQFPPNSPATAALGFGNLQPEKSTNFSCGFVTHPLPGLQLTVDAYQIKLKNRIVPSAAIFGYDGSYGVVSQAVMDALVARGIDTTDATSYAGINIFTNGADTRTRGVEATLDYASDFGDAGKVNWSLGFNYNETKLLKINPLPAAVTNADYGQTNLLDLNSIDGLTRSTPRVKVIANALWTIGDFSINLREAIYGVTSQATSFSGSGAGGGATVLRIGTSAITDLNVGYKITPKIRFDVGANNLFNKKAPTVPNTDGRPTNGGNIYGAPITFTPWGINGGYYYARATFTF